MRTSAHPLRESFNSLISDNNLDTLFNSSALFNESTLESFDFKGVSSYIEQSSIIKNNVENMFDIFPNLDELVGEMDLAARYGEEELEE